MGMYLKYGVYQHSLNECAIAITRQGLFNAHGVQYAVRHRWDVQGRLQAASQGALTTAIAGLESAYATQGRDICLYVEGGAATAHVLRSSLARGGVRVVQPPSFPDGANAEYTLWRNYTLAVEADLPDDAVGLLSWAELLSFRGTTGPVGGFLPVINGPPQPQTFRQRSTMTATQQGAAVGNQAYPLPPPPMWPAAEHQHLRNVSREVPADNSGRRRVTWSYTFESAGTLTGQPTAKTIN